MNQAKVTTQRKIEKLQMAIAWKMPKWLVYYCGIRIIGYATTHRYSDAHAPNVTAMEAIYEWQTQAEGPRPGSTE